MSEPMPIPDTLGDYLSEVDLIALPFGADHPLGIETWPWDAREIFGRMNTDEQHSYVFHAAWWAAQNGVNVRTIASVSLRMLAGGF